VLAATPSSELRRPERERVFGSSGGGTVATIGVEVVVVVVEVVGIPVDFASRVTERVNAASRSNEQCEIVTARIAWN
jgi:hypothetical protein